MVGLFLLANVSTTFATDGHFLHGTGAVNSAMGGAGISAPESLLGTFNLVQSHLGGAHAPRP
jgi:hypothetical protein